MSWPSAWWKYSMSSLTGWLSISVAENQVTGWSGLAEFWVSSPPLLSSAPQSRWAASEEAACFPALMLF